MLIVVVYGAAPTTVNSDIRPKNPSAEDDLIGYCTGCDGDGDYLLYYYRWYKDGALEFSGKSSASFIGEVYTGDIWHTKDTWSEKTVATDGSYFWVLNNSGVVSKYSLDGIYTNEKWDLTPENSNALGITSDGNYIWINDREDDLIYKYYMNGTYTGENWNITSNSPNDHYDRSLGDDKDDVYSLSTDGNYIWICNPPNKKVSRYYMNGTYTGESFLAKPKDGRSIGKIATNGDYMWALGKGKNDFFDTIFRFHMNGTYAGKYFRVREYSYLGTDLVAHQNSLWYINYDGSVVRYSLYLGSSGQPEDANANNLSSVYTSVMDNWTFSCLAYDKEGNATNWKNDSVLIRCDGICNNFCPENPLCWDVDPDCKINGMLNDTDNDGLSDCYDVCYLENSANMKNESCMTYYGNFNYASGCWWGVPTNESYVYNTTNCSYMEQDYPCRDYYNLNNTCDGYGDLIMNTDCSSAYDLVPTGTNCGSYYNFSCYENNITYNYYNKSCNYEGGCDLNIEPRKTVEHCEDYEKCNPDIYFVGSSGSDYELSCVCLNDTDNDCVCDEIDNCRHGINCNNSLSNCYNPDQADSDNDGIGDICDGQNGEGGNQNPGDGGTNAGDENFIDIPTNGVNESDCISSLNSLGKNYTGKCSIVGQTNCFDENGTIDWCCGDNTTENWIDSMGYGCYNSPNYGGGMKSVFLKDPDDSALFCEDLNKTYNLNYTWCYDSRYEIIGAARCCGDDPGETWSYATDEYLADIIVNSICYGGKWIIRGEKDFMYYDIWSRFAS